MKRIGGCFLLLAIIAVTIFSCRKESFTNNPSALLRFSRDSLHFDTVFTTTGSVSAMIKIFNNNDKGIHLSSVMLAGGASSPFKINVDGIPGPQVRDVDVAGKDSAYIFVTVSINPNLSSQPFIVRDSIAVSYNGHTKFIQLDAYGQNAHFFRNRIIKDNETWNNDLPYVILGSITVDTNALLIINKGVKVFMHADAPFIVNGSLQVKGEKWDSTRVVFSGDRLDEPYRQYPASYPGLFFMQASHNNLLSYAIIKNAYQGVVVNEQSNGTKLTLNETIIDNAYDAGLIGINTSISARNLLISNCGKNLVLMKGGNYNFTHCTVASFSTGFMPHKEPVLYLANHAQGSTASLFARFQNCIFWGEANGVVKDEVVVSRLGNMAFNVSFEGVLWRLQNPVPAGVSATAVINNLYPQFEAIHASLPYYNFRLKENSPAVNKGIMTNVTIDLDGNPRPIGLPDLGAYERQ